MSVEVSQPEADTLSLSVRISDVAELLRTSAPKQPWWTLESLRGVFGNDARRSKALAHAFGPDVREPEYAFLAANVTQAYGDKARDVQRSVVFLNPKSNGLAKLLVTFDYIIGSDSPRANQWSIRELENPAFHGNITTGSMSRFRPGWSVANTTFLPGSGQYAIASKPESRTDNSSPAASEFWRVDVSSKEVLNETQFFNVMQFLHGDLAVPAPLYDVSSTDLAGVRVGNRVVLFHSERGVARSSVWFDISGKDKLKCLVTGLAPGMWEVWWNGWLEDQGVGVEPPKGSLYFEGPPGSYFLRNLD